jgi:hypothetical protein
MLSIPIHRFLADLKVDAKCIYENHGYIFKNIEGEYRVWYDMDHHMPMEDYEYEYKGCYLLARYKANMEDEGKKCNLCSDCDYVEGEDYNWIHLTLGEDAIVCSKENLVYVDQAFPMFVRQGYYYPFDQNETVGAYNSNNLLKVFRNDDTMPPSIPITKIQDRYYVSINSQSVEIVGNFEYEGKEMTRWFAFTNPCWYSQITSTIKSFK